MLQSPHATSRNNPHSEDTPLCASSLCIQYVQLPLMYNLEHMHTCMLLLQVKDVECHKEARIMASKAQHFMEATQCRRTRLR